MTDSNHYCHCQSSVKNHINVCPSTQASLQDVPLYLAIALQHGRTRQVAYVKETLQPLICAVIDGVESEALDLETDPCIVSFLFPVPGPLCLPSLRSTDKE